MPSAREDKIVRIGGACGFWGDCRLATPQLLADGNLDYLVYDYLAEITMSILARARSRDSALGFARDFLTAVLEPNLSEIARQDVKIVSNAGGVNPVACAEAVRRLVADHGLDLRVAVITGDDLMERAGKLAAKQPLEMFSNAPFPAVESLYSVNAYLGAFPVARALEAGADIVITGRIADSALALGPCVYEFGWDPGSHDLLAGGSLAGHILECGAQATGGNFTDWELAADDAADIGYPIAEVSADSTFVCTKPRASGGLVTPQTVSEQMLYEIGDPQAYVLPDVVCDFSAVTMTSEADDRVRVKGARGYPAPADYKVSATWADGFRGGQVLFFRGFEADRKARHHAAVAIKRASRRLAETGLSEFTETAVELVGDESGYGPRQEPKHVREVALKIAARHPDSRALQILFEEISGLSLGGPPGLAGFAGGRPRPSPVIRLFSLTLPQDEVEVDVRMEGRQWRFRSTPGKACFDAAAIVRPPCPEEPERTNELIDVPLIRLAIGRSGDKGDNANIGIIARRAEYMPWIWAGLTEQVVERVFAHFLDGGRERPVERFHLPGLPAINFLLHGVLGGGGIASLRNDPQGKTYAQILLGYPIPVPAALLEAN